MRTAKASDYTVDVDGEGTFTFGRREMKDHLKIQVEYSRIVEGCEPTNWLDQLATWISTLRVLMVSGPKEFDVDGMDPLDENEYLRIMKVFTSMREKEDSFRRSSKVAGNGAGTGSSGNAGVLVSPQVPTGAERSALSGNDAGGNVG